MPHDVPDPVQQAQPPEIATLVHASRRLALAWGIHAFWFATMCVAAWRFGGGGGLKIALLLALVTVPPVLIHAARVHRLCRALNPRARTIGLLPMLVMTVLFTPFESGLIVPAKNLWEARRLLRARG